MEEKRQAETMLYDYQEVIAKNHNAAFLLESYQKLGWELEGQQVCAAPGKSSVPQQMHIIFRMKRNRKIVNKMELSRLQRNFEGCVHEIDKMERNKISVAVLTSIILGLFGAFALVLAVLFFVHHWYIFALLFAGAGIAGCILPIRVYPEVLAQQTEKIEPFIQETYREIDAILEKGNKLIY